MKILLTETMRGQKSFAPLIICLLVMLFTNQALSAQTTAKIKVTGVVIDIHNDPIIGASVVLNNNASVGTVTDLNGQFILEVPAKSLIKVSSIGYATKLIRVEKDSNINIKLDEDENLMKEVVVTAMGITREAKSLSYARQSVNTESMTESRGTSLLDMLSGKAAGMHVTSGGGPLASTGIVIRGNSSLTGSNQPLYVIDGVPVINESGEDGDLDYGSIVNGMNPDEIENVEILRGANASALYGSAAANGVVMITTKKATRKEGYGVSYGFNLMLGMLYNFPTYQNIYGTGQNGRFQKGYNYYGATGGSLAYDSDLPYGIYNPNLAGADNRSWGMPMLGFDIVGRNGIVKPYSPAKGTVEELYRTGTTMTNSFSFDKAADNHTFRFSYTNMNSDDIMENYNEFERHNFSFRATAKLAKFLNLDANVRYMYEDVSNRGFRGNSARNPIYIITSMPRDITVKELTPWKNPDGTALSRSGFYNPYWLINEISNGDDKHWLTGNITFNITLPYNFSMRLRAATDVQNARGWAFTNYYTPFDIDGGYRITSSRTVNNSFDGLLFYKKRFSDFSFNADIGVSHQDVETRRLSSSVDVLMEPDKKNLANNAGTLLSSEGYSGKIKQAIFGTSSLGYKDWFYFDLTARNEWSSTLPSTDWSYFYYSLGSSAILTDLFKVDKKVLSFAKLRASYAKVGNDASFDMLYSGYYYGGTFVDAPYYQGESTNKNPYLKPETTFSWELGGDFKFWNNRASIDFTYYTKKSKDQIVAADAPLGSGYSRRIVNAGEIKNWGTELALSVTPVKTKNISWTTTINWAKNNSEVVSLPDGIRRIELGSADKGTKLYAEVGKPYGVLYGNDYKRDENGNIYVGLTGIPKYEPDQYLCSVHPDWFGGWINSFKVKNVNFGFMIDFQKGGNVWSYTAYRGGIDGNTVQSLKGRKEYEFAILVLGENADELKGLMSPGNTVKPGANYVGNHVLYPDKDRPKGVQIGGTVYDPSEEYWGGKESNTWVAPTQHWTHNNGTSMHTYIYDASYIKLREVSVGYTFPAKMLSKTPFRSASFMLVGRNVAILHQNTPRGVDPQATATVGNARGFERSYSLPMATWGFDLKVSF